MVKKETNNAEKRKYQRIGLLLSVKYKKPKNNSFRDSMACQDISGKGVKILLREALKTKEQIDILICPKDKSNPISSLCRVAWCKQTKNSNFMAGLEFVRIKEQERFMEFLCEKIMDSSLQ